MTGASLPVLHSDMFTRAGLPNLQRLFLRYKDQTKRQRHTTALQILSYTFYILHRKHILENGAVKKNL